MQKRYITVPCPADHLVKSYLVFFAIRLLNIIGKNPLSPLSWIIFLAIAIFVMAFGKAIR